MYILSVNVHYTIARCCNRRYPQIPLLNFKISLQINSTSIIASANCRANSTPAEIFKSAKNQKMLPRIRQSAGQRISFLQHAILCVHIASFAVKINLNRRERKGYAEFRKENHCSPTYFTSKSPLGDLRAGQ